eukprot:Nitzschia sp. Nitz4//scaffold14_size191712//94631//95325//NITZ4_001722-RA/size191712-snap-gene-0.153-mRNA-1//-1//CDS//3329536924//1135//frame0
MSSGNGNWIFQKFQDLNDAHTRFVHKVHTAWRYPLPPWGRAVMGFVYFSIPVIVGYNISTYAVSISEATVQERFSQIDTNHSVQGLGDKRIVHQESGEDGGEPNVVTQQVGAGGWGGGVHLVTSDQETQEINRVNLERFLKKQRRLKEKREAAAQEGEATTSANSS